MDDLTKEEQAEAAKQNWGLFYIYDVDRNKFVRGILPITFSPTVGAVQALNHVVAQARFNNSLCLKALRLMGQHNAGKTK